jgi:uncharacterized protein (TIRG00374 family)
VEASNGRTGRLSALTKRALTLAITAFCLYLVFPSLVEVFGSWPKLVDLRPWWLLPMIGLELMSFTCLWELQRICLRTRLWRPVILAHLAGNAFSRIVPGGAAAGAAVQYPMLTDAGIPAGRVASALATSNVLTFSALLALPILSLPAILLGVPVDRGLANAAWFGAAGFVLIAVLAGIMVTFDRPLILAGRFAQDVRNRVRRRTPPITELPERLLRERDQTLAALGNRWYKALFAAFGWWLFDYGALLLALAAIGARPEPSLVLLAYAGGLALSMIPLTPGGIGFVEAGLTGLLALAGISAGPAALATLAYRLVSYWLPLPAGAIAVIIHRRHYGSRPMPQSA